jgi:hypothetical protein
MHRTQPLGIGLIVATLVAIAVANVGFTSTTVITNQGFANDVFVADVNGDDVPDLITDHFRNKMVVVREGNGDGTFGDEELLQYDGTWIATSVRDVDGDGDVDIIAETLGTAVDPTMITTRMVRGVMTIFQNDGEGEFTKVELDGLGQTAGVFHLLDANGDDELDILRQTGFGDSLLIADGLGGFGEPAFVEAFFDLTRGTTRAVGNFDEDDDVEILLAGGRIANIEDGALTNETDIEDLSFGRNVVATGDFDGDGSLDIVTAQFQFSLSSELVVALNDGTGESFDKTTYTGITNPYRISVGDADDDGDLDIALVGQSNGATIYVNDGDGGFEDTAFVTHPGDRVVVQGVRLADIVGDDALELLTVNVIESEVSIFEQNLAPPPVVSSISPSSIFRGQVVTFDVVGSGFADEVFADLGEGLLLEELTVISPTQLQMRVRAFPVFSPTTPIGTREITIRNADGRSDLVALDVLLGPNPGVAAVSPSRAFAASTIDVQVSGLSFDEGASLDFGDGIAAASVERVSDTLMRARITIDADAATGPRAVHVTNGSQTTGRLSEAFTVLPPLAYEVVQRKGTLLDREKEGRDTLRVSTRYVANEFATGAIEDPRDDEVTVTVGDTFDGFTFVIPANDDGWKRRKGKFTWKSPRRTAPQLKLTIEPKKNRASVLVKKTDLVVPGDDVIRVDLAIGVDRGIRDDLWQTFRKGIRLR